MPAYLRVVNWEIYQHYKDRTPPWIKLHNSLLEDPGIAALPDATKAHLFGLWLLASRLNNRIPADPAFIAKRINATDTVDLKAMMLMGFLESHPDSDESASKALATCTAEKRREEESREETPLPPTGVGESDLVRQVFQRWQEVMGHADAKLLPKRRRCIQARLREGYTVAQLCEAIAGCKASPFHMGKNDENRVHDDLTLICRNGENVERFMGMKPRSEAPGTKYGLPTKAPWEESA